MSPVIAMRLPLLPLLLLCAHSATLYSQSPYSTPLSRVIKNEDGTMRTVQVDTNKQRVEEILKSATGAVIWRLVNELDDEMQPIHGVKFDGQDQVISRHKYLCLRGRTEEEEIFDAKNTYLAKMVYFYDNKGRINRIDHYSPTGVLLSTSKSKGGTVEPIRREVSSTPQTPPPKPR